MGQTVMGSNARQVGKAQLMSPQQQQALNSLLGGNLGGAQQAFGNLLGGYSEDTFQKGVVDPAMKTYQQQILPALEQRYSDLNLGSSSALNQALAQSAGDLSNLLAGQRINLQQSMAGQQQNALNSLLGLIGQRSFDPIVQGPQRGLLHDAIGAGSQIGAGALSGGFGLNPSKWF
jgi:hypothetical protein